MTKAFIKALLLTGVLGLLSVSCTHKSESVSVESIAFEKDMDSLASYFSSVKVLPLETKEECLLSGITRIKPVKDKIVILDNFRGRQAVYAFDRNTGKFCNEIGHKGEGPEEYISVSDFFIDKDENVCLLDRYRRTIMKYTPEGRYLSTDSSLVMPSNIVHIVPVGEEYLLLHNYLDDAEKGAFCGIVNRTEKTTEPFDFFAPVVTDHMILLCDHPAAATKEGAKFIKFLNDTVFNINQKGRISPRYRLALPKQFPTKEIVSEYAPGHLTLDDFDLIEKQGDFFGSFSGIFETDRLLVLTTYTGGGNYWIDKQTGNGYFQKTASYIEPSFVDMFNGKSAVYIVDSNDKELIASIPSHVVKHIFKRYPDIVPVSDNLKIIADTIDKESNPILFIYEH